VVQNPISSPPFPTVTGHHENPPGNTRHQGLVPSSDHSSDASRFARGRGASRGAVATARGDPHRRGLAGLTELVVTSNYALALVFVTPLALLLVRLAVPEPTGLLLRDRLVEILLGVGIGLHVAVATRERKPRAGAG